MGLTNGRKLERLFIVLLSCLFCIFTLSACGGGSGDNSSDSTNTISTVESKTLTGMHDTLGGSQASGFSTVSNMTGAQPDLLSIDYGFSAKSIQLNDAIDFRNDQLDKIKKVYSTKHNLVVQLSFHSCNPSLPDDQRYGEPVCNYLDGVQKPLTADQWNDLLYNSESAIYKRWSLTKENFKKYLYSILDLGVTVYIRPLHEPNMPGMWWASGTPSQYKLLWNELQDDINSKSYSNLKWVWSVGYHPNYWNNIGDWYPGDSRVDVLAADVYPSSKELFPEQALNLGAVSEKLHKTSPTKEIALSEVSMLPSKSQLDTYGFTYVNVWGLNMLLANNSNTRISSFFKKEN